MKEMLEWCTADILHNRVRELIAPASSVMDIGCGIRPQQYIIPDLLICVEPHHEYVEILKKNLHGTNTIIISLDAKAALTMFPDKSVDSIFLIDIIEHMPKNIGQEVLLECERIARKQIIIFTPLGFMPQEAHTVDVWNLHGGEWQEHKSGWYPEDFPGWYILGCKNLHTHSVKGESITTPYGGFYAIRNITYTENHFNNIYSKEILSNVTSNLDQIKANFPKFVEQVIDRETIKSTLKCGLWACQQTTMLLMEYGKTESLQEILKKVGNEKEKILVEETKKYILKINKFAEQFGDINFANKEIDTLQKLLKTTTDQLIVNTEELEILKEQFGNINSANKEIDILQELLKTTTDQLIVNTEELEILKEQLENSNKNRSIFIKIYAKMKRILNKLKAI